jgi:hypothetical protein
VEIDPRYVDLAILRWQKITGADAILDSTKSSASDQKVAPAQRVFAKRKTDRRRRFSDGKEPTRFAQERAGRLPAAVAVAPVEAWAKRQSQWQKEGQEERGNYSEPNHAKEGHDYDNGKPRQITVHERLFLKYVVPALQGNLKAAAFLLKIYAEGPRQGGCT